jgi:hypothetical protein
MHPTCGILRHFQAFFWLWVFSCSQSESTLRPHAGNANRWAFIFETRNFYLMDLLFSNMLNNGLENRIQTNIATNMGKVSNL